MTRRFTFVLLLVLVLSLAVVHADTQSLIAPDHAFPKVGPYEVLSADFHMHTINSDGKLTTRQRVEESLAKGYDVIAITDHRTTRPYTIAKHVGAQLGLVVLTGIEAGVSKKEHMNVIGFSTDYKPRNPHSWSETPGGETVYYRDEMQAIKECGGFLIYNHPHVGFREPVEWGVKEGIIQGIEVENDVCGNGWATTEWNGRWCYPNAFEYALKNNLTILADTDVHGNRSDNPAKTLVFAEARTPEAVMDALRARRTAAWFEGVVWGREDLLTDMMQASVNVYKSKDGLGNPCLRIENHSPLALQATISGVTEQPVDIGPYQEMPVKCIWNEDKVSITWENVWTSPDTKLAVAHKCPADK